MDPATNTPVASLRIDASTASYRKLIRWARLFPQRRWAVENAKVLGCNLTQWLIAQDEHVQKGLSGIRCNWSGSLLLVVMLEPQKRRPSKVMVKALRAGFQRFIQRFWPVPFGSSDLTTG